MDRQSVSMLCGGLCARSYEKLEPVIYFPNLAVETLALPNQKVPETTKDLLR